MALLKGTKLGSKSNTLKYDIKSRLALLTEEKKSATIRKIVKRLEANSIGSVSTFYLWMKIPANRKTEIPYKALVIIADELGAESIEALYVQLETIAA